MNFIVNGYDYTDEHGLEKRMKAREKHMEEIEAMVKEKKILFAAAMINDAGYMYGSTLIVNFESREELDTWLASEPYVANKVWERMEIIQCRIPPIFLDEEVEPESED